MKLKLILNILFILFCIFVDLQYFFGNLCKYFLYCLKTKGRDSEIMLFLSKFNETNKSLIMTTYYILIYLLFLFLLITKSEHILQIFVDTFF